MKKIILSETPDYDIKLAGIVSATPLYRLVWLINNHLNFELSLVEDWPVSLPGAKETPEVSWHTCYRFADEALNLNWEILKNRGTGAILLKTRPLADYLMILKGEDYANDFDHSTKLLQNLQDITAIMPIDFNTLKDKEKYIQ